MSSLADALIPPETYNDVKEEKHEASHSPAADLFGDDVEMQPKSEGEGGKDEDEQDEPMEDLFGEDNEVTESRDESAASPTPSGHVSDGLSSDERRRRQELEYGEEDEPQPEYEQVLEAAVQIPNIPVPKSSDGNFWVIRMPNFVQVDSKPFHHETYMGPENEDEDGPQPETVREKSMSIKLKVENTVRWRWIKDENGQYRRQSNSRVIRWSDGSLSLLLGKELFDISQTIDTSGTIPRQSLGSSQPTQSSQSTQPTQPATPGPKSQGLTYLVAQHKRAFILQSEAVVTGYMSLRPTGMQSETHRMLVRAVGQKHNKVARLRMAPDPTMDPEREKMELMKTQSKKPKKIRTMEDDGFGAHRRRRSGVSRKRSGDMMWSDEDDDEDIFEASEDEVGGMGSPQRSKKKAAPSDQRKGGGDYMPDDFLVADSSEEGDAASDDGGPKKKRRRGAHDDEGEEDDLEKLEAKIEEDERKRRRQEPSASAAAGAGGGDEPEPEGADEAMDVESEEEDDEEARVRKAGTGSRKKRAVVDFDEDEEE